MLVRITWILVVAAAGTLIGGFFTPDSNVLLFVAIGLALLVIVLVVVSWMQRAREASSYAYDEGRVFADDEEADEELFAALESDDEEFAVGGPRRSTRTARRRPATRKTSRPKAKPAKAKPRARAARSSSAKPKSSSAKPKAARKAKPKSTGGTSARPKSKPQRRRPSAEPGSPSESAE